MKKLVLLSAMLAAFALGGAAALAGNLDKPSSPPGQGECEHGNSQKPCKDDPQPDRGKDCEEHGNQGGVNEDHCLIQTTPVETVPDSTTPDPTTPELTTPGPTTPESTPSAPTTPAQPDAPKGNPGATVQPTPVPAPESAQPVAETAQTDSSATEKPKVLAPKVRVLGAMTAKPSPAQVAAVATRPTKAPQAAPFTP